MQKMASTLLLMTALFHASLLGAKEDDPSPAGCVHHSVRYDIGTVMVMNPTSATSDGEATLMICTFVVDSEQDQYPALAHRRYVWTAFHW